MESSTNYYENVSNEMNATQQPEDQVHLLMQQVADEAGIELKHKIGDAKVSNLKVPAQKESVSENTEDKLSERLRALRSWRNCSEGWKFVDSMKTMIIVVFNC